MLQRLDRSPADIVAVPDCLGPKLKHYSVRISYDAGVRVVGQNILEVEIRSTDEAAGVVARQKR